MKKENLNKKMKLCTVLAAVMVAGACCCARDNVCAKVADQPFDDVMIEALSSSGVTSEALKNPAVLSKILGKELGNKHQLLKLVDDQDKEMPQVLSCEYVPSLDLDPNGYAVFRIWDVKQNLETSPFQKSRKLRVKIFKKNADGSQGDEVLNKDESYVDFFAKSPNGECYQCLFNDPNIVAGNAKFLFNKFEFNFGEKYIVEFYEMLTEGKGNEEPKYVGEKFIARAEWDSKKPEKSSSLENYVFAEDDERTKPYRLISSENKELTSDVVIGVALKSMKDNNQTYFQISIIGNENDKKSVIAKHKKLVADLLDSNGKVVCVYDLEGGKVANYGIKHFEGSHLFGNERLLSSNDLSRVDKIVLYDKDDVERKNSVGYLKISGKEIEEKVQSSKLENVVFPESFRSVI